MRSVHDVLLTIDKPLQEEIITNGGLKLFLDPNYQPEWYCSVNGVVAALPEGIDNLAIGDEVAFSYKVVSDRDIPKNTDYFMPIDENPFRKKWINSARDTLIKMALPGVINHIWIGLLTDIYGNRIDGHQGTESDIDRWISQFSFSGVQDLKFNNLLDMDGEHLWKAQPQLIFAKKTSLGIEAIGDRVICEPIEVELKTKIELVEGKPLPYQSVKARFYDRAKVISGGESAGIKPGDVIGFNEMFLEKYDLWGKQYFIIKTNRVEGIWHETLTTFTEM